MKRGIFYNSKKSACSIWESGKMCYDALKNSEKYILNYSEDQSLDYSYDFAIFNQHYIVNKWMTKEIVNKFNKPVFCIVTEVSFGSNPIEFSQDFFNHYIVLDPTINETDIIHAFGRPIEDFDLSNINENDINYDIPNIFSFGFPTPGKEWHKIIELVQNDYDNANIHFHIPMADQIVFRHSLELISNIYNDCNSIILKPGIILKITHNNLSKNELIELCSKQTINCFFYNRNHMYKSGLSAVTDQAISSGRPLLVTNDPTFRHIHKYINSLQEIGSIKKAITCTQKGVLQMKKDWSSVNFLHKFEKILM